VVQHFACNIYKIFNYKCNIKKFSHEEAWYTEINSVVIHDFFYNIKGLRPNKKYIPKCILMSSTNYQCAFIRGLFEDGYVHLKNEKFDTIAFTFKNHKMKNQLSSIFLNLGIRITFATRKKITQAGKLNILYDLYIFKRGALIYRDKIGFISKEKNDRLLCIDSDYERELNNELGDILCKNWSGPHNQISLNIVNSKNHSLTDYSWNKLKPYIINNKSLPDQIFQFIDSIISKYYICRVKTVERYFDKTACLEMPESHVFIQNGFFGGNSQGSQYNKVLYLNENIMRTNEDQRKLTYTAITRAIDVINIVI
jgi:intein/homing endonuclease